MTRRLPHHSNGVSPPFKEPSASKRAPQSMRTERLRGEPSLRNASRKKTRRCCSFPSLGPAFMVSVDCFARSLCALILLLAIIPSDRLLSFTSEDASGMTRESCLLPPRCSASSRTLVPSSPGSPPPTSFTTTGTSSGRRLKAGKDNPQTTRRLGAGVHVAQCVDQCFRWCAREQ